MIDRVPPQDIELERSILATMLTVPECLMHGIAVLAEHDFYSNSHKSIFDAIVKVGDNADVMSINAYLNDHDNSERTFGIGYLFEMSENIHTYNLSNFVGHCDILIDKSRKRQIITLGSKSMDWCFNGEDHSMDICNTIGVELDKISDNRGNDCASAMSELVPEFFENLDLQRQGKTVGVCSGFVALDDRIGGFVPKELTILAGRPGMGKTAAALCIARNVCYSGGVVHFASLEMGKQGLTKRLMSIASGINNKRMKKGMTKNELNTLGIHAGPVSELRLVIDDKPRQTMLYLKSQALKTKRRYNGLDLIIMDYLQLGKATGTSTDPTHQVTELARGAQALVKDLNCAGLFLSQLNRSVDRSENKKPRLSDLRQSGAIEECADIVVFCYRPGYYNKDEKGLRNSAQLLVEKNRDGECGAVEMCFEPEYTRWSDVEYKHVDF